MCRGVPWCRERKRKGKREGRMDFKVGGGIGSSHQWRIGMGEGIFFFLSIFIV